MKWQPIETAPRDGAEVLGYMSGGYAECDCCRRNVLGPFIAEIKFFRPDGWFTVDSIEAFPTHWMPLPEPPEAA